MLGVMVRRVMLVSAQRMCAASQHPAGFASKLALQLMAASEDVSTRLPVLKPMDIYGTSVSQCAPAGNGRDDLASAAVRGFEHASLLVQPI